jgi:hypothetical protein
VAPIATFKIDTSRGLYPIVYVRGYAATSGEREDTFYDAYYGYSASSVEKRQAAPPQFLEPLVFEGQLIRLIKQYGYVDAANGGLALGLKGVSGVTHNPTRSLWVSRFYDKDVMFDKIRPILDHAEDLRDLICKRIPQELKSLPGVDLGTNDGDYKVILIAHSMGGLVCRCLIQNLLANKGRDPKRWIHRLVTIGTPHGGIELSAVPDFLEELVATRKNAFGSAIFKETAMREYLKLGKGTDLRSLNGTFPEGRCLCLIGSDYGSYSMVKKATGSHSDGLVKQDNAYIQGAYWANVHRAHSGRRGIVNSFESYENIRRFLFGDVRVRIWLENVTLLTAKPPNEIHEFYDIDFSLSVRGTGVLLHQRRQNPCENAIRHNWRDFPIPNVHLHTGFLDTKLRADGDIYSHFLLAFRVGQHRVKTGFLFDNEYPERTIYSESMEVRLDLGAAGAPATVQYRWLSDTTDIDDKQTWQTAQFDGKTGGLKFALRQANTIAADLCMQAGPWEDATTQQTRIDAARA